MKDTGRTSSTRRGSLEPPERLHYPRPPLPGSVRTPVPLPQKLRRLPGPAAKPPPAAPKASSLQPPFVLSPTVSTMPIIASPTPPPPTRSDRHNYRAALIAASELGIGVQLSDCISHRLNRVEPARIRLDVDDRYPTAQVGQSVVATINDCHAVRIFRLHGGNSQDFSRILVRLDHDRNLDSLASRFQIAEQIVVIQIDFTDHHVKIVALE